MDSLTHICLGACIGEIALGKKLGKKALLWGALAQSLPDIDIVASLFVSPDKDLLIHRGITHSLVFAVIVGLLIALLAGRVHRKSLLPPGLLAIFFVSQIALHDLLDTCNSYGTGLLEPFNHTRFSINLLYVADPLFTIGLFIATIFLAFKNTSNPNRKKWAAGAIILSVLYLCFSVINKTIIDNRVKANFEAAGLNPEKYFTTPTPLNNMLWYIVTAADTGYYTSYSSIWDDGKSPLNFISHQKNYSLLNTTVNRDIANNLESFADGYYTLTETNNTVCLNVLRFGQIQGWQNNEAPFAFSYPLVNSRDQYLLLQKGRIAGWNMGAIKTYIKRISGNQPANTTPQTK
jgi:inner membrane protein